MDGGDEAEDDDDYGEDEEMEDEEEEEEEEEEEGEEIENAARRGAPRNGPEPQRALSSDLMQLLENARQRIIDGNIKYEPEYYTTELTPDDTRFMKMYLLTTGIPVIKKKGAEGAATPSASKKVLTVFVGATQASVYKHVHKHNNIGKDHKYRPTKKGAMQWSLNMIIFIPQTLREIISTISLKQYWRKSHGYGKITRGIYLHRFFGLACYVSPNAGHRAAVDAQKKNLARQYIKPYDFKPAGVQNINKHLMVD